VGSSSPVSQMMCCPASQRCSTSLSSRKARSFSPSGVIGPQHGSARAGAARQTNAIRPISTARIVRIYPPSPGQTTLRSQTRRQIMAPPPPFGANSAAARDIANVLHPYTDLQTHQQVGPMVVTRGKGVRVWDDTGKDYIESVAGLWCA